MTLRHDCPDCHRIVDRVDSLGRCPPCRLAAHDSAFLARHRAELSAARAAHARGETTNIWRMKKALEARVLVERQAREEQLAARRAQRQRQRREAARARQVEPAPVVVERAPRPVRTSLAHTRAEAERCPACASALGADGRLLYCRARCGWSEIVKVAS